MLMHGHVFFNEYSVKVWFHTTFRNDLSNCTIPVKIRVKKAFISEKYLQTIHVYLQVSAQVFEKGDVNLRNFTNGVRILRKF